MRLVNIDSLTVNEKIGVTIRNYNGGVLLSANTVVTPRYVESLRNSGIRTVYVEDDFFQDAIVKQAISVDTKTEALKRLNQLFESVDKNANFDAGILKPCVKSILDDIGIRVNEPVSILNNFAIKDARCNHAIDVATLVAAMARFYTYEEDLHSDVIEDYVFAALVHDLFLKSMNDDLKDKSHPEKVFQYLKAKHICSGKAYMTAYMHHENYDGSGFPTQKAKDDIYIGSRLLAIADLYNNLVNGYAGYPVMKEHEAYEYINAQAGKTLDPNILNCFNKSIAIYPIGATVLLSNGYDAIITEQTAMPSRPKVRLSMPKREDCLLFNLMQETTLFIEKVLI